MQGAFCVWNENKKGLRDLRLKPAQRHLFLYEKMMLFTKRAAKDTHRETYHYKNALKVSIFKHFHFWDPIKCEFLYQSLKHHYLSTNQIRYI